MSNLAVLVPVLRRPGRVAPLLQAFAATTPDYSLYFITDPDDAGERKAIHDAGGTILCELPGSYAEKINKAVTLTREPLLFLGADDLEPQLGWFDAAHSKLLEQGAQVVGINDMLKRSRELATHFLITREYAERPIITGEPGPLCEQYAHNCVDDELLATAKHRGVYAYAEDALVRHLHPDVGAAQWDDVYLKGRSSLGPDRKLWKYRRITFLDL
jgi:hypothetical protein